MNYFNIEKDSIYVLLIIDILIKVTYVLIKSIVCAFN